MQTALNFYDNNAVMTNDEIDHVSSKNQAISNAIRHYFSQHPYHELTADEMAKIIGYSKHSVRSRFSELFREGCIDKVGKRAGESKVMVTVWKWCNKGNDLFDLIIK